MALYDCLAWFCFVLIHQLIARYQGGTTSDVNLITWIGGKQQVVTNNIIISLESKIRFVGLGVV